MRDFAHLYAELDTSTSDAERLNALVHYLGNATPADAAWAVYLLAGGKPSQTVPRTVLQQAAMDAAGLDEWLFDACHQAVGDWAETIALILPATSAPTDDASLAAWLEHRLHGLHDLPAHEQASWLRERWQQLDPTGRWVLVKLVSSGWRVAISPLLVQRALALHAGLPVHPIAQRLPGYLQAGQPPSVERLLDLLNADSAHPDDAGRPYGFAAVTPLAQSEHAVAASLGPVGPWVVEWQYLGARIQIIKRAGRVWVWTGDGELLNARVPEIVAHALGLPDGVALEGELLAWQGAAPAAHSQLAQRLSRKTASRAALAQTPLGFIAADLLESDAMDRRAEPLHQRRTRLEALMAPVAAPDWQLPLALSGTDWPAISLQRDAGRARGCDGVVIRHRDAAHGSAWFWPSPPFCIRAVLLYVQPDATPRGAGSGVDRGRTDYTWGLWNRAPRDAAESQASVEAMGRREMARPDDLQLVSVAKTSVGLSEDERLRIDQVVRATLLEKFGPVRSVRPTLIAVLAFEGVDRNARRKSGLSLRGAHMVRLQADRPLHEADDLGMLEALLPAPRH